MYPWYYVWSPNYRIFHEILKYTVGDLSGVSLRPLCMPQHIFAPRVESGHFLTGIGIKIYCLLKSLQAHPDQHIIFSDVDLIVPDKDLSQKLKAYEKNDITAMIEKDNSDEYNIGFLLVKSTPTVIQFFQTVLQKIHKEVRLDQDVFNEELKTFAGTHGAFDRKDFIQSNMIRKDIWDAGNYSVIQCLYAGESWKDRMCGKLATIIYYYNITHLLQFVDREIVESLQQYIFHQNPNHYLASVNLDAIYKVEEPSSTEQLSENA